MYSPSRGVDLRTRMPDARGRVPAAGGPSFELLRDGLTSGVHNLDPLLTINGVGVLPTFVYRGGDATTSNWTAATYGETLTAAGSGGSVNQGSPLLGADDDSVNPDGTRNWQASGNSFADVTTEDVVIEWVGCWSTTNSITLLNKYSGGGWQVSEASDELRLLMNDGTIRVVDTAALTNGVWYHAILFLDRSGSGQWYVNSAASGAAVDVSAAAGSLTKATPLTLANNYDAPIAYLAMWKRDAWLDTHLQADVAKERFQRLVGFYPQIAKGTATWNTFTRATTATLDKVEYDSEELPEPLDFSDAAWSKTASTATTATGITTPAGVQAYTLHETSAGGNFHYLTDAVSAAADVVYELSLKVKANNRTFAALQATGGGMWASNPIVYFDVSNGTVGTIGGSVLASGIQSEGSGWYRCWFRVLTTGAGTASFNIYAAEADGDASFTGLDQDSLYIANASVKEYARKPYLVGAGWPRVCYRQEATSGADVKHYLPETAATNLCTDSDDFSVAAWTKTQCSIAATSVALPDGSTGTVNTLHEDAAAGTHLMGDAFTQAASTAYVLSVWAKAANRNWLRLGIHSSTDGWGQADYDLSTGIVGTEAGNDSADIEDWGNGWFRCWIRDTRTTAEGASIYIYAGEADNDVTFTGLNQDSLYIWGAQVEADVDYPTSRIPTSGATATRNGDVLYFTGDDGNVADNQMGTMEVTTLYPDMSSTLFPYALALSDGGSGTDRIALYLNTTNKMVGITRENGASNGAVYPTTVVSDGNGYVSRITYTSDNLRNYTDGVEDGTADTDCGVPDDLDRISVGCAQAGGFQTNGLVGNIKIWPSPKAP